MKRLISGQQPKNKDISRKNGTSRSTVIKNENGIVLTDRADVIPKWREDMGSLYDAQRFVEPH